MGHLYVIRHGQSQCNADGVIQGPRLDPPLSELGARQADALGAAFQETHLDAVFVSPMRRARETAQGIITHQADVAPRIAPEMYELDYGAYCGRRLSDVQDEMLQVFDAWRMGFVDQPFPGGESALLAQHRVRNFAAAVRALDGHVAIVAHGRINRVLLATLTGAPLSEQDRFPQDNANISHIGPAGLRVNDTSHLAGIAS